MFISCVVLMCAICGITYGVVANVNQLDVNESTKVVESRQDGSILAGDSASLVIPLEELSDRLASPWSVDKLFFSGRTTEEYGSILVSGVQKLDDEIRFEAWNGLIVSVKDGVATTYQNGTSLSGRRLLNIFDDVWGKIKGTVDTVKDAFNATWKSIFGKSFLDTWMEITVQKMDEDAKTAEAVGGVVKFVNPKLGNCIQNPYDNFLDCFTVAPCFDYMRQVVEEWSKQCGNDGGCLMNDARGEFSSDRFLSMARGLVSPLEECARTDNPEGCKNFANCLTGGMNFYNKYAP